MSSTTGRSYNNRNKNNKAQTTTHDYPQTLTHPQQIPNGNPANVLQFAAPQVQIDPSYPDSRPPSNFSSTGTYSSQMRAPSGNNGGQIKQQTQMAHVPMPTINLPPGAAQLVNSGAAGGAAQYTLNINTMQEMNHRFSKPFQAPTHALPSVYQPAPFYPAGGVPISATNQLVSSGNFVPTQHLYSQTPFVFCQQAQVPQQSFHQNSANFTIPPPVTVPPTNAYQQYPSVSSTMNMPAMNPQTYINTQQPHSVVASTHGTMQPQVYLPHNLWPSQQSSGAPPDPPQPPQQQTQQPPQQSNATTHHAKKLPTKVLAIVDPNTHSVINQEAVENSAKAKEREEFETCGRTSSEPIQTPGVQSRPESERSAAAEPWKSPCQELASKVATLAIDVPAAEELSTYCAKNSAEKFVETTDDSMTVDAANLRCVDGQNETISESPVIEMVKSGQEYKSNANLVPDTNQMTEKLTDATLEDGEIRDDEVSNRSSSIPPSSNADIDDCRNPKYSEWLSRLEKLRSADDFDIEKFVYGRDFLMLCNEILIERNEHKPPKTEEDLKIFSIDKQSNQPNQLQQYEKRGVSGQNRGSFNPSWINSNPIPTRPLTRPQYVGRASDNRQRRNKQGPTPRPSIERTTVNVELKQADNAWTRGKKMPVSSEKESKELYLKVRGILNKITPSTFEDLCKDFLDLGIHQLGEEQMEDIIDIIFDKAVEEPKFCPLYSDLCKRQVGKEINHTGSRQKSKFRNGILTKCQKTFESKKEEEKEAEMKQKREEAEAVSDEKKRQLLLAGLEETERKDRRRMFGNVGFIGQLYRNELLVPLILHWCIVHLLKAAGNSPGVEVDEESIECAVKMLETVGKIFERDCSSKVEEHTKFGLYIGHLEEMCKKVSNRVRFSIENLIELKRNNWIPRKSADQGPKTLQEIHTQAKHEEIQNKLERDQYDASRSRQDYCRRGNRANPPLIGRGSQDGRPPYSGRQSQGTQEKRAQAAAAASSTISSATSKKEISLSKLEMAGSTLGGKKNSWITGAGGGGAAVQQQQLEKKIVGIARKGMTGSGESSQPSSREASESRKSSDGISSERQQALNMAASVTGKMPTPNTTTTASSMTFLSSSENEATAVPGPSSVAIEKATEIEPVNEEKLKRGLGHDCKEYFSDDVKLQVIVDEILERIKLAPASTVFRLLIQIGVENVANACERRYVGQILCRLLQEHKHAALDGMVSYVKASVTNETWVDVPKLWDNLAEVIIWSICCEQEHCPGARPNLDDFADTFQAAQEANTKPHVLMVLVLKRMLEEMESQAVEMSYAEMKSVDRHSEELKSALSAVSVKDRTLREWLSP